MNIFRRIKRLEFFLEDIRQKRKTILYYGEYYDERKDDWSNAKCYYDGIEATYTVPNSSLSSSSTASSSTSSSSSITSSSTSASSSSSMSTPSSRWVRFRKEDIQDEIGNMIKIHNGWLKKENVFFYNDVYAPLRKKIEKAVKSKEKKG